MAVKGLKQQVGGLCAAESKKAKTIKNEADQG